MQARNRDSEAHGRCISSLQVTYHEEFHKPPPRKLPRPQLPNASLPPSHTSCGLTNQTLDDSYEDLQDTRELNFFCPSRKPTLPPAIAPPRGIFRPTATSSPPVVWRPSNLQHTTKPLPLPLLPFLLHVNHLNRFLLSFAILTTLSMVYLEDGLRHRVNIEIEHFRASIQEVLCDQFTTHRSQAGMGCMGTGCFQHTAALTKMQMEQEDAQLQIEEYQEHHLTSSQNDSIVTSVDSGVEMSPTAKLEEQMSLSLIRLQTLAAIISTNLQKEEYSTSN